jgi:hypothetical protein
LKIKKTMRYHFITCVLTSLAAAMPQTPTSGRPLQLSDLGEIVSKLGIDPAKATPDPASG